MTKVGQASAFYRPQQLFLNTDRGFGCFASRCVNAPVIAFGKIKSIASAARILRERHG